MKIGMNLLLWAAHVTKEHYPQLEKIKATGFDGAKIPIFGGDDAHYLKLLIARLANKVFAEGSGAAPTAASSPGLAFARAERTNRAPPRQSRYRCPSRPPLRDACAAPFRSRKHCPSVPRVL